MMYRLFFIMTALILTCEVSAQQKDSSLFIQKYRRIEYYEKVLSKYYYTNIGGYNTRMRNDLRKIEVKESMIEQYLKQIAEKSKQLVGNNNSEQIKNITSEIKSVNDSIAAERARIKVLHAGISKFTKEVTAVEKEFIQLKYDMIRFQNGEISLKEIDKIHLRYKKKM